MALELELGVGGRRGVVHGVGAEVGAHVAVTQVGDLAVGDWGGGAVAGIEMEGALRKWWGKSSSGTLNLMNLSMLRQKK